MRALCLLLMGFSSAAAQPEDSRPAFDVASVKPSPRTPGQDAIAINLGTAQHGTVTLGNTTLSECIRWAYGLASEDQVSGPDWIRDRELRVDIVAKAPPDTPVDQLRLMTQRLLAERFLLAMHTEKKPVAHGELTVYKNGPPRSDSQEPGPSSYKSYGRGRIAYDHIAMPTLAVLLSRQLRQPVVDRTGLGGYYNVDLRWTPDEPAPAGAPPDAPEYPDIYRAIQQQLGLRLEQTKTPLDVLVIDHAEKVPAGN